MTNPSQIFSHVVPANYDEVAVLSRLTAEVLISRLSLVTPQPSIILDVGCGTGYGSELLKQEYPNAQIVSIDSELSMLHYLKEKRKKCCHPVSGIVESLPLKNNSVDLIFANFLLPWCTNWDAVFFEWRRILRKDGLLVFTCFGPDTLREYQGKLVIQRHDMHDVGDQLLHAKFSDPVMDIERFTMTYQSPQKLMYELQQNGMIELSASIDSNLLELTFEVIYGHAWGPSIIGCVPDENGVVKISVDSLKRKT